MSAGSTAASTSKASPTKDELKLEIQELELEVEELKQEVEGPDQVLPHEIVAESHEESKVSVPESYQPTIQEMMQQRM